MRGENIPLITPFKKLKEKQKKTKTTEGENIPQWGNPPYNPPKGKKQRNKRLIKNYSIPQYITTLSF